jgi:hypothetical protein
MELGARQEEDDPSLKLGELVDASKPAFSADADAVHLDAGVEERCRTKAGAIGLEPCPCRSHACDRMTVSLELWSPECRDRVT